MNALSGLTFLVGGLLAYVVSSAADVSVLVPLAAGNFLYVGASDLVPEVNRLRTLRQSATHFGALLLGLVLLALFARFQPGLVRARRARGDPPERGSPVGADPCGGGARPCTGAGPGGGTRPAPLRGVGGSMHAGRTRPRWTRDAQAGARPPERPARRGDRR